MHKTVSPENWREYEYKPVIALVGPQYSGKSTIADLLEDLDATSVNLNIRPYAIDEIREVTEEQADTSEEIIVFDSVFNSTTLEKIKDVFNMVLVLRVDAPGKPVRRQRFMDDHLSDLRGSTDTIPDDFVEHLDREWESMEEVVGEIPQHHVKIVCDEHTETTELIVRLDELTQVIRG